jgi:hypothetical protein
MLLANDRFNADSSTCVYFDLIWFATAMILSRGSLILGGLVMAVLAKKGSSMPEILPTPASSFSTSQAIPTGTPAMPSDSDPESQQAWFKSEWSLPQMAFATDLNITYNFQQSIDSINLDLVLCQTNATGSEPLTTDNTWSVLSLPSKFGLFQYAA